MRVLQLGEACEKYFGAFAKQPTARLEALLLGLEMTVFDVSPKNSEPFAPPAAVLTSV